MILGLPGRVTRAHRGRGDVSPHGPSTSSRARAFLLTQNLDQLEGLMRGMPLEGTDDIDW